MWKTFAKQKKIKALTLTELLVVMVIIGILVLLALPNLMPTVTKAKTMEAKTNLGHLHAMQEVYNMENSTYSDNLQAIGFEQNKLKTEGGSALYRFEIISASPSAFKARAEAVVDFDKDGVFNVWEIDQDKNLVEVVPD